MVNLHPTCILKAVKMSLLTREN